VVKFIHVMLSHNLSALSRSESFGRLLLENI